MPFRKSRADKASDKAHDLFDTVKEKLDDSDTLTQVKEKLDDAASSVKEAVSDVDTDGLKKSAKEQAAEAKARVADFTAPAAAKVNDTIDDNEQLSTARDKAAKAASKGEKKAAKAAESTRGEASHLFNDELLPRLEAALAAAGAGAATVAQKLPEPAQEQVAKVAPDLVKRKKKGGLLIVLGLAAIAGAGYLYWQGQQKAQQAQASTDAAAKPVDRREDAVGDLEKKADDALTAPTGKHAARD